jgi:hypothetical protein
VIVAFWTRVYRFFSHFFFRAIALFSAWVSRVYTILCPATSAHNEISDKSSQLLYFWGAYLLSFIAWPVFLGFWSFQIMTKVWFRLLFDNFQNPKLLGCSLATHCFNPNWHETGRTYLLYNFRIGFCQLNFYQKFPNIFGDENLGQSG